MFPVLPRPVSRRHPSRKVLRPRRPRVRDPVLLTPHPPPRSPVTPTLPPHSPPPPFTRPLGRPETTRNTLHYSSTSDDKGHVTLGDFVGESRCTGKSPRVRPTHTSHLKSAPFSSPSSSRVPPTTLLGPLLSPRLKPCRRPTPVLTCLPHVKVKLSKVPSTFYSLPDSYDGRVTELLGPQTTAVVDFPL